MKIKLTSLFLFIALSIQAQEYKVFVASTEKSIQLKWMSKTINEKASFDVYRKENGGSWQKVNDKPITASPVISIADLKTNKNPFPNDQKYATYIDYKNRKEASENKQAYANYSLVMAAILDNDLARHLGIYFEDKTVDVGKKYQYKIVNAGNQKELSVSSIIQIGDKAPAPIELKAQQEKQNVSLTWKVNEEFVGYNVYKNGVKLNDEMVMPNAEKNLNYQVNLTDEAVSPGSQSYTVKGITFLNTESQPATEAVILVKDLSPPTGISNLKATRKENEIVLQWKASKDKEAKGYFVYKSTDKGKTFKKLNTTLLTVTTENYSDAKTAEDFGSFQYQIETVDAAGNARPSMPVSIFIPDHVAPEMPKSLTTRIESGKISLIWQSNTEKDLLGYRIYRGLKDDDENSMLLLNVKPQTATTFIDTFPKKASTKFIYKVAALDQSFNESKKASVWAQLPDIIPPTAPFLRTAMLKENTVQLQWDEVKTDAILGYNVYRIYENEKTKVNATYITTGNYTDSSALKKGIYEYYIQAIDSAKLESKPSNRLFVNTISSEGRIVRLNASQDLSSKKVVLEIIGITPDEVQTAKLYRKTGLSGFKAVPFQFLRTTFADEDSEPGKIYEYYLDVVDQNGERFQSEIVHFNNP